jgi:hypothetical protein
MRGESGGFAVRLSKEVQEVLGPVSTAKTSRSPGWEPWPLRLRRRPVLTLIKTKAAGSWTFREERALADGRTLVLGSMAEPWPHGGLLAIEGTAGCVMSLTALYPIDLFDGFLELAGLLDSDVAQWLYWRLRDFQDSEEPVHAQKRVAENDYSVSFSAAVVDGVAALVFRIWAI